MEWQPFSNGAVAAAEFYPSCTNGQGMLVKASNEIITLKDICDHVLFHIACTDCKTKMQESILFANWYGLEACGPRYKIPPSKVYFAEAYGRNGSSELVTMKFVYNKSHLQAGLDTRYSDDGEQIFGND